MHKVYIRILDIFEIKKELMCIEMFEMRKIADVNFKHLKLRNIEIFLP